MSQLKNFQLFICFNNSSADLNITSFQSGESIVSYTFDEKFTEKEYGQCSLTFNAPLYIGDVKNPYIDYLVIDRRLKLIFNNKRVDFYITDRTPSFSSSNVNYSFICQDAFSYELSRATSEISISTDDEDITNWNGHIGPKPIQILVNKVLEISHSKWKLDSTAYSNSMFYENNSTKDNTQQMQISLEITNSTPYNIITEIAKQFNAIVYVDYYANRVMFFQNELTNFKGLYLRPETNLSNFSYSEKGSSLCNVLRVFGSEAADGSYVSILPPTPSVIAWILDNDTENSIDWNQKLSEVVYNEETKTEKTIYPLKDALTNFIENNYPLNTITNDADAKTEKATIKEELDNYYNRLLLVPCGTSILYNFDYWYKKRLIDAKTKQEIERKWSVDLRNLNIRYNAYLPTYLRMKYEINKIEDQEQEYITQLAAESASYANTEESNISQDAIYISKCIPVEKKGEAIQYYLHIGTLIAMPKEEGEEWEKNYYFDYGKNKYSTISSLPDLNSFGANTLIKNLYHITVGKDGEEFTKIKDEKITQDADIQKRFYIKNVDITNSNIYLLYNSITDAIKNVDQNINSQNNTTLHNSLQDQYISNLQNLYDDNYYYLKYNIYGKDWCDKEIEKYTKLFKDKLTKQKEIVARLKTNFGDNWQTYEVKNENTAPNQNFILYADLVSQYNNCSIYIGGVGTIKDSNDKFLTYEGRYNYYLKLLREQLKPGFEKWFEERKTVLEKELTISEKVEKAKKELDEWWSIWYRDYGYITRESKYEDSDQTDYKGLYTAAYLQFKINSKPEVNYNISYIKSEWIEDSNTIINVGDKIKIYQHNLNEEYDNEQAEFVLDYNLKDTKNILVCYYQTDTGKKCYFTPADFQIINDNKILIIDSQIKNFWNNSIFIDSIIIPNKNITFKFNDSAYRIIGVNKVVDEQPIELRITGITHDLRSDIYQLQVSEYTMYKTLVDRLLSVIK